MWRARASCLITSLVAVVAAGCGSGTVPPLSTATLLGAGTAAYRQGDTNAALQLFQRAVKQAPTDAGAHYDLGTAEEAEHQDSRAIADFDTALRYDSGLTSALYDEATILTASAPSRAEALYRRVISQRRDSPTAYLNLGLLEAQQGRQGQALSDLRQALSLEPGLRTRIPPRRARRPVPVGRDRCGPGGTDRDDRGAVSADRPTVTVFTPSHDTRFLDAAYRSLADQSFPDWEWVVLLNGKARTWAPPTADERVRVSRAPARVKGVGAVKRAACELALGDLLVELDHDDLLAPGCLAHVVKAFDDPAVVLVYSDWAQINEDGSPNHDRFDEGNGWRYSRGSFGGQAIERCHAMAPTPHNLGYIWYAPNHVRAFRRTAYDEAGGYNPQLEYLDDQDLMVRLYRIGEFRHVQRCLYYQRVHARMTQLETRVNAAIQVQTVVNYRRHIEDLFLTWANRRGLRSLRLRTPVWIGDESDGRYEELTVDPDEPILTGDGNTVGLIKAYDVFQRIRNRTGFFNENYRVLTHGGMLMTQTPSTDGRGAFQDPSVVSYWNENSFMYFTQQALHDLVPDLDASFQISYLATSYQSEGHSELDISYIQANLLAVKDGPRQGGPILC